LVSEENLCLWGHVRDTRTQRLTDTDRHTPTYDRVEKADRQTYTLTETFGQTEANI